MGADPKSDVNLGIFYQEDSANKRLILKSSDPRTLAQIDAIFVTVETKPEPAKPSGKPLFVHIPSHSAQSPLESIHAGYRFIVFVLEMQAESIIDGLVQSPSGTCLIAQHPDGSVWEYIEPADSGAG
jgi:hypothetical protein